MSTIILTKYNKKEKIEEYYENKEKKKEYFEKKKRKDSICKIILEIILVIKKKTLKNIVEFL